MYQKESARMTGRRGELCADSYHTMDTHPLHAFIDSLRADMAAHDITPPSEIIPDGCMHRFHVDGDRRGRVNGWYVLHVDGVPAAAYGSWKLGVTHTWCARKPETLTAAERDNLRRRMEAARKQRDQEQARQHAEAAKQAKEIWDDSRAADPGHGYLLKKNVKPLSARQQGAGLVIPVIGYDGQIKSLQFIYPDGSKRLLPGGAKKGNFIPVYGDMPSPRLLICEGWATGATLAEMEPAACVFAAVDAGNLEAVAVGARKRWPSAEIIVCCDRDEVGKAKGRAAAIAAGAKIAIPDFPEGSTGTDFNDLATVLAGRAK